MWNIIKVVPLYKCGSKLDMDNYRPASILPIFSKTLECVVHNDLNLFLTKNNLFSPYQYGFCTGYSTELANICLSDTIRQSADQGMLTGAVFVDLRKAFNSVNHQLLLSKLSSKGVNGNELEWFRNHLSRWLQTVCFNENYSDLLEITVGIPQGSILGPLLFTI